MGVETERKFLVAGDGWQSAPSSNLVQGYVSDVEDVRAIVTLSPTPSLTIQRISHAGDDATTPTRWQIDITEADAGEMLELVGVVDNDLVTGERVTVRVRHDNESAWVTVKGPSVGASQPEWEWPVGLAAAIEMLDLCDNLIAKRRHRVPSGVHVFEVDVYFGPNAPLVTAEVELDDVAEFVELPEWIGLEVTDDRRYKNRQLSLQPFGTWVRD